MRYQRKFYIPQKYDKKIQDKELGIEIYFYEANNGKPACKGFGGKRGKPDFSYYFPTEEQRTEHVHHYIEKMKRLAKMKIQRREEKKQFKHGYIVGDILYSSWGYDQTNIDFYQVTEIVSDKTIKIRQIAGKVVENIGWASDMVVARKNNFLPDEKEMTKRVRRGIGDEGKGVITLTSYANAYEWDGSPKNRTSYA